MTYYKIDKPKAVPESIYHQILANVAKKVSHIDGVESVYQIGGISAPGISDLDMVVVFKNDFASDFNLHESLSVEEKYLFIHKLYGCSRKYFLESSGFSFFNNFSLLEGQEIERDGRSKFLDLAEIKSQIALEYMLKMYVNLMLQKEYKILQVRSLLLHGKALSYDLDFLGVDAVGLKKSVNDLLHIRKNWFDDSDGIHRLESWFKEFVVIFPEVLSSVLRVRGLHLDAEWKLMVARNISLSKSDSLSCKREGIHLPAFPAALIGKKYFRLLNKLNNFEISVPLKEGDLSDSLRKYFFFQKTQKEYNRKFLPHFYPLSSSLLA